MSAGALVKDGRTDQVSKSPRPSNDRQQQPPGSVEGRGIPQGGQTGSHCLGCIYFVIKIISNNIKREDPFFFMELTPTLALLELLRLNFYILLCPRSSRIPLTCWEYCSHQKAYSLRAANKTGELGQHRSEEAKGGL